MALKTFNTDIDILGKINTIAPNAAGGLILTYSTATKTISHRTYAEFIDDVKLVTTNTIQTITHNKEFSGGFTMKGYSTWADTTKNLAYTGKLVFGGANLTHISDSAYAFGDSVFPSMNLQPYNPVTEPWNNKGYLGIGSAIFINYTGNTNYRPDHNAHDSWIGIGRALGAGFLDGTNITMLGTTNMHRNDVLYGDSITVIGKGNSNGITANGVPLSPTRVVTTASTGFNIRNLMNDVIIIGHENWIEDIHSSVILGSNTRPYGYVYNSVVLGSNNSNWNIVVDPGAPKVNLDHDLIIGIGNWKRTQRHSPTHNLLIGMDIAYGSGSSPNFDYRSLIEGNFKEGFMRVNGEIYAGHSKENTDQPNEIDLPLSNEGVKGGPIFDPVSGEYTYNGSEPTTSNTIAVLNANPNKAVYVKIESINQTQGTWGFTFNGNVDSGNVNGYAYRTSVIIKVSSNFLISTAGNFRGIIRVTLRETDLNGSGTLPNIILSDSYEYDTVEIRGGKNDNRHMMMGLNAGKFLHMGTDSIVFGNNAFAKSTFAVSSIIMGNNAGRNMSSIHNSVIIGYGSFINAYEGSGANTAVGNNIMENPTVRIVGNSAFGTDSLKRFQQGSNNTTNGYGSGTFLLIGDNNVFNGTNAGLIQNGSNNTFIGFSAGGYGLLTSTVNNTIVIGANAVPEVANNTVTIGTANNTDNYLYGRIHANSFRVRGGLVTQVMMADGSLKDETLFGSGHTHSNIAFLNNINQNLGTTSSPTFNRIQLSRLGAVGTYDSSQTQGIWGMDPSYSVNGFSTTGLGTLYGIGYSYISVGGSSVSNLHQIHFAEAGTAKVSIVLSSGDVRAYSFTKIGGTATQLLRANGTVIDQSSLMQTIAVSAEGADDGGQYISISGGNMMQISDRFVGSRDTPSRNPNDIKPITSTRRVRFDFANASTIPGATGNYGGVMTYAPWTGDTASTGDSSYQLAFINESGVNGSGNAGLKLRKGIDNTWGSWISILTSANGVSKFNSESIGGTKTFTNQIIATGGVGNRYWEGPIRIDGGGTSDPLRFPTLGFLHTGMYGATISLQSSEFHFKDDTTFTILRSGAHYAPAFYESSLRELKTNIKTFDKSGVELINSLDIVTFDRKDKSIKGKIGVIADDTKEEFLSETLDSVDLYKTIFIQAKAIQELEARIKKLEEKL